MRKKVIAVFFVALLTGTLSGCGNDTYSNKESSDKYGYDEILIKIAASIESGEESENGEFSYMYPRYGSRGTSDFGYAYIRINEDEQALVVGENGTLEYPSILYDMYEVVDGKFVHIFSGGERDRYYATDTTGAFIEEGASSAIVSFYDTFLVRDGKRMSTEFVREPQKINIVLTPFTSLDKSEMDNIEEQLVEKNSTVNRSAEKQSTEKRSSSKKHGIEVTDDRGIVKKWPKTAKAGDKVTIKTNSFMDAIPKISINGNDIGEWDKNRTEYTFIMPDEDVKIIATLKSAGGA